MRLPKLPRIRFAKKISPSAVNGIHLKQVIGGVLVFIVFFCLGFYILFPSDALRERIESEIAARSELDLRMGKMVLTFPPGLRATAVTASVASLPLPPLKADRVAMDPRWLSLAGGDQAIDFRTELYGGWIDGSLRRSGAVDIEFGAIEFALPLIPESSLLAEGVLDRGSFSTVLPPGEKDATDLQLAADGVRINGLDALGLPGGAVSLGRVALAGDGIGNSFKIEQVSATGGDLEVTGDGALYLANPLERSRINLALVVRPAPGLDQGTAGLLEMVGKPGREGSRRLRVTGTLGRPVLR